MTNMSISASVERGLSKADFISDTRDMHLLVMNPKEDFEQAREDIREKIITHESLVSDSKLFVLGIFLVSIVLSIGIFVVNRDQFFSWSTVIFSFVVLLNPLLFWVISKLSLFRMKRDIKQIVKEFSQSKQSKTTQVELGVEESYIQALMSLPTRRSMEFLKSHISKMYPKLLIDPIVSTDDMESSASRIKMFVILAKKEGGF